MKPKLQTLKTNWRILVSGILIILAVAFVADIVEASVARSGDLVWLTGVVEVVRGFANLAAINVAAFVMIVLAWPTLNKFSNIRFRTVWDDLSDPVKLECYVIACAVELIAAAIVF